MRMKNKTNISKFKPLKRLIIQSNFKNTLEQLANLKITEIKEDINFGKSDVAYDKNKMNLTLIGEDKKKTYQMDALHGSQKINDFPFIAAYDESINKFSALEGVAYLFSHAVIYIYKEEYIPTTYVAIYFFTKAHKFKTENDGIIVTDNIPYTSKEIYVRDKVEFLKNIIYPNTLLFIDGPLIGGDWYVKMITAIKDFFTPHNIIPIFLVKNSQSSIIVDSFSELKGKYNSDLHWAYYHLKRGERTPFFLYRDIKNPRNARVFCYLKALEVSPIRVEFHPITFQRYQSIIDGIMDIIYYLMLVQGSEKNPQLRLIAIAEKYAREALHLFDLERVIKSSKLIPTINQERFGWSV